MLEQGAVLLMELPIQPPQWINRITHSFFSPFLQPANLVEEGPIIMPMTEVKRNLHEHYINQQPLQIVFEFYDQHHQLQVADLVLTVASPILTDHTVDLEYKGQSISLQLEQILSVSANTFKQSA